MCVCARSCMCVCVYASFRARDAQSAGCHRRPQRRREKLARPDPRYPIVMLMIKGCVAAHAHLFKFLINTHVSALWKPTDTPTGTCSSTLAHGSTSYRRSPIHIVQHTHALGTTKVVARLIQKALESQEEVRVVLMCTCLTRVVR